MIALGTAMQNVGADKWLVDEMISVVGTASPILVLGCFYLVAMLLTEFISNNAVAILLTPIAYQTAMKLGYHPVPFLIAIMFAASASFATPIGYQTNTFVYGAGGYKFRDFLRVGAPLNLLFLVVVTLLIPLFWPLK
jgi:di/tricarboxylate transporter